MTRMTLIIALTLVAGLAHAGEPRTLCVYDPSGANGDIFNLIKDYRTAAVAWGVDFELKPYTDEKTAADDFKAGQCDATLITGVRARAFHRFTATIEAMGALADYKQLKGVIKKLSSKPASKLMKKGDYEIGGIFPGGAVYLFVRDKNIKTVSDLAGKKMATLSFDKAAKVMVEKSGASMVAADIGTFSGMFNNGSVDACYAPAYAYKALELYKGIGKTGGVLKYPLAQLTLQLVLKTNRFTPEFGVESRAYAANQFDMALKLNTAAEKLIPAGEWINIDKAARDKYDAMFIDVRVRLRDEEKVYDKSMLTVLRRVRCQADGARAECAEKRE
ncbi:hypothetical protein KKF91_03225 [Myxococcota bacterium]|nr:hypothetical protein [Myxococcota bacterium]MBU1429553.1 hypothetical protein [Myxococcota bacterium]MBU1898535.1 hypothetical protein [Myxococcota bacterium]